MCSTCVCAYECVHLSMSVCAFECMYVCMCAYECMHVCVCVCARSGKCCKLTINSNCVAHCKAEFWCVCVCVCFFVLFLCVFFMLTESTNKGVNQHAEDVIQVKQQRKKKKNIYTLFQAHSATQVSCLVVRMLKHNY